MRAELKRSQEQCYGLRKSRKQETQKTAAPLPDRHHSTAAPCYRSGLQLTPSFFRQASHERSQTIMWAFLFLCFLPGARSQGGFVWLWGSEGQSCTAACSEALTPGTGQPGGLTCVKRFSKIGDSRP